MKQIFIVTVLFCMLAGNAAAGLDNGLVMYYPFSGDATDLSGNENNGTVHGATLTSDRFGRANSAYSFNGVDSYITIPQTFTFHQQTDASMSFWMKRNDDTHRAIFWTRGDSSDTDRFNIYSGYGIFGLDYRSPIGNVTTISEMTTNMSEWVHIAFTRHGNSYSVYKNGVLAGEFTDQAPNLPSYVGEWFIGNRSGYMFSGAIDEVRVYNRALTTAEVNTLAGTDLTGCFTLGETPVGRVTVTLTQPEFHDRKVLTDRHGCYSFENVVPTRSYRLTVSDSTLLKED